MEIIDFRIRLRTAHMLKPWDVENPAPHFEQYIKLYDMIPRLTVLSDQEFIENMNKQGISKGVVCGGSIEDNDHLILKKKSSQANYYFIAGVDPKSGIKRNIEELNKCKTEGFLGGNFSPYIWGIPANSKLLYPLYAYCESAGMVAIIHGSLHYNRYQSMWLGDPKYIDEIAMNFPKLKIVISHAGNGFGVLGLAVAQKHPNVYLEFSALWPKYLPESTLTAVNTYLKHRCLFGTDYPLVEFSKGLKAWKDAVRPDVQKLFFYKNAVQCLLGRPE